MLQTFLRHNQQPNLPNLMEPPMEINVDTSDALEMGPVDAGEYQLQVLKAEFKQADPSAENQWKGIALTLDIPEEFSAQIFNTMVWIPDPDSQEAKRYETTKSAFDKFKKAFGFGPSEAFTLNDLVGKQPWAYLTVKDDPEYGPQNKVSSWIAGPSAGQPSY